MATTYEVTVGGGTNSFTVTQKVNGNIVGQNNYSNGSALLSIANGVVDFKFPRKQDDFSLPIAQIALPVNNGTEPDVYSKLNAIIF